MKILLHFIFLFVSISVSLAQSNPTSLAPKYIKVPQGYVMVLKQGDTLFTELEKFMWKENIPSANFTGMGFVNVEFGFFNFSKKKFKSKKYTDLELASLHGTIAWQNNKPSVHAHGIGGDKNFRAFAGHILSAVVGTGSLEIMLTIHDQKLERVKDEALGANVLDLRD